MRGKVKKLTNTEIASFCSQMSMLLQAGIMPVDAMMILIADTRDEASKKILNEILESCIEGNHLHKAMESTGVFPNYVITMITIGEDSGCLDVVMQSLADFYDCEEGMADSLRSAVTYPLIMVFMMFLVILILLTKVLPIFQQVFEQLGASLTGISASLLQLGNTLEHCSIVIMSILVLLALFIFYATHTVSGKKRLEIFFGNLPLFRSFQDKLAAGRFANGMSLLLQSGIDISQSLFLVTELVENERMREKIGVCRSSLENGLNLSEALIKANIFNTLYSRMVSVGFKSGNLPRVMSKIASCYEDETNKKLSGIISILEPTLVIILSFVVGIILMSVILPLMSVMSSIG